MNMHIARALTSVAIAGAALGSAWVGTAIGHADVYDDENTILLSQIADEIDAIPACVMEDGSDLIFPGSGVGRCLWTNPSIKGDVWLTYEDRSYQIIDDTVTFPEMGR